ncbi:uncharacterized protein LY89DRAFT_710952 [Mollisia scopiformis]|uniref:BRCT domain-containing protein n=1 Tax=Mollisia scopiformis TaxID=149040 RepID=A0A132BAZ7_MOLSC|nr:uncharacterized protein LY89DRAFT_710952 [Mollisia scopiformis]KUJ09561.1 hypothetical protein LY89DRAFT_710952 [Mollisia scopiformis]
MDPQSPPKRVTRARAAAKDTAPELKTTKIATASSKAKVTRSVSTTKRKTRADDHHEEEQQQPEPEEIIEPKTKPSTRGRPKKVVEPAAEMDEPPVRTTRAKRAAVETPAPEATRATRGRSKKIEVQEEEAVVVEQPAKRAPRTRAATTTKAAPKKSVKFDEPDKENIIPIEINGKGKAKATEPATGLRAKPVRKPAVPARTTRGRAKSVVEEEKSSPLSPKKATQVGKAKETASDDELATNEKTPMRPLMKSPIKPPGSAFGTAKKLDFSTTVTAHKAVMSSTQDLKGSIVASPARRPPQSPFKESLKASPQRSMMGGSLLQSPFKPSLAAPRAAPANSPFKVSLLQSPARRPQSPTKVTETGSPTRSGNSNSMFATTPKASTFKISRFATPRTVTKSAIKTGQMLPPSAFRETPAASSLASSLSTNEALSVEPSLTFSGRLSSIMPREADPAFTRDDSVQDTIENVEAICETAQVDEPMMIDEPQHMAEEEIDTIVVDDQMDETTTTPPSSPPRHSTGFAGAFTLRETDENPFHDSDSEDELASSSHQYSPGPLTGFRSSSHDFTSSPSTPTPFSVLSKSKTPQTATQRAERRDKIGFTPLARQLSDWMAASPAKSESSASDIDQLSYSTTSFAKAIEADIAASARPSPAKSTFFEDEMSVRDELVDAPDTPLMGTDMLTENFEPVEVDEEDMALAHEADEMSLLEPDQIEAPEPEEMFTAAAVADAENVEDDHDDIVGEATPSEASQEYGDENAIPIDPALLALAEAPQASTPRAYATPKRVLSERVCHTVSKVPLKPAADHTPMRPSPVKRSASISRLPTQRPTTLLTRKNTVISYSPTKSTPRAPAVEQNQDVIMQDTFATPSKADGVAWSTMGTPARTPRRDINNELLKGAVVFVDVHTSEGADASALFTELLTQMGARCVKSWNWNGEDGSKVSITHLVFKDGGKRALEKAKETNGVVSCVGVGWVLDCERENKWLDESAYAVDTTMVPRGGHRRRKSMEPRALANLNGTLVPSSAMTPGRNMSPTKEFLNLDTPVTSKSRRRESVQWVHSPSGSSPDENDQTLILSPVPATPAPETISAYGEEGLYGGETPGGQTPYFLHKEQLVQKTAPAGRRFVDSEQNEGESRMSMGTGFLSEKKDESVMMRLMAARRKSLQWAPKVGSPLARGELF